MNHIILMKELCVWFFYSLLLFLQGFDLFIWQFQWVFCLFVSFIIFKSDSLLILSPAPVKIFPNDFSLKCFFLYILLPKMCLRFFFFFDISALISLICFPLEIVWFNSYHLQIFPFFPVFFRTKNTARKDTKRYIYNIYIFSLFSTKTLILAVT